MLMATVRSVTRPCTNGPWSLVAALLLVLIVPFMATGTAHAQEVPELKVNSKHYIVIDADTGEVFAQRGAHDQVAVGSLTKIYTAIEALESAPLSSTLVTSEDDLLDSNNSLMGFDPGEELSLEELLYGLMLPSGNDAALTIARNLGAEPDDTAEESVQRFVASVNQRIVDMGLTETHLMNPHGWGVPGHYSSAHDLAVFTMYALQYPEFVNLISSRTYKTAEGNTIRNNNRLLTDLDYPELVGGKTGYDWDAGWCLIEVAERNGNTMISVTLDGYHENNDWYDDNRVLLNYALDQKEERQANNGATTGERLSYFDPDAAVIARGAAGGATLSTTIDASLAGERASAPGGPPARTTTNDGALVRSGRGGDTGLDARILSALAVAALIIGGQASKTAFDHRQRRRPMRLRSN